LFEDFAAHESDEAVVDLVAENEAHEELAVASSIGDAVDYIVAEEEEEEEELGAVEDAVVADVDFGEPAIEHTVADKAGMLLLVVSFLQQHVALQLSFAAPLQLAAFAIVVVAAATVVVASFELPLVYGASLLLALLQYAFGFLLRRVLHALLLSEHVLLPVVVSFPLPLARAPVLQ